MKIPAQCITANKIQAGCASQAHFVRHGFSDNLKMWRAPSSGNHRKDLIDFNLSDLLRTEQFTSLGITMPVSMQVAFSDYLRTSELPGVGLSQEDLVKRLVQEGLLPSYTTARGYAISFSTELPGGAFSQVSSQFKPSQGSYD